MARPIKIRINVTRVLKEHLYAGQNGKYLDLVAWPKKTGPDKNGNTHMVCQEVSKEAREAGEKGPILGDLLLPDEAPPPARTQPPPARQQRPAQQAAEETIADGMQEDDIPF